MARFQELFSYPDGDLAAVSGGKWVKQSGSTNWTYLVESHRLKITHLTAGDSAILWAYEAAGASSGDLDVLAQLTITDVTKLANGAPIGPAIIDTSQNASYALRYPAAGRWQIAYFVNVTAMANIGNAYDGVAIQSGVPIWLRIRRVGSALNAMVWADGQPMPGAFPMAGTHATITSARMGLSFVNYPPNPYYVGPMGFGTGADAAEPPGVQISDAGNELFTPGQTGIVVAGAAFGGVQGQLYLSPTNNVSDPNRVAQTITGWSDTSIVFTCAAGTLPRDKDLYLFAVTSEGKSNPVGYVVRIVATGPSIIDAGDESFYAGESVTLVGSGFGATQGTGKVYLCPTNNVAAAGRVEQTVTAWGASAVTFTVARGALNWLTQLYLFVVANDGQSNPQGYAVQLEPRVFLQDTITDLGGNPVALNGEALLVWRKRPTAAAPNPDQVITLGSVPNGQINQELTRGNLTPGDPVWAALFDPTGQRATARRIVPKYQ